MIPPLPTTVAGVRVRHLLEDVRQWAAARPDVVAVALVESWARGAARPDSDVDLVVVAQDPAGYLAFPGWLAAFGRPTDRRDERYGDLRALRVWFADGPEVEFGFVRPSWCGLHPIDLGAARVVRAGAAILHDPNGALARFVAAVATEP